MSELGLAIAALQQADRDWQRMIDAKRRAEIRRFTWQLFLISLATSVAIAIAARLLA